MLPDESELYATFNSNKIYTEKQEELILHWKFEKRLIFLKIFVTLYFAPFFTNFENP